MGGSAWELKIDPKRFREKIKNDIEKIITKRSEKKSIKSDQRLSVKTWSEPGGRSGRSGGGVRGGR